LPRSEAQRPRLTISLDDKTAVVFACAGYDFDVMVQIVEDDILANDW
jgi:hypothetical protein